MSLDDEIDRRGFVEKSLKFGGLALASTLMPAWLAGCLGNAPSPTPNIKYITIAELMNKLNNCEFKSAGETVYVRDAVPHDVEYNAEHDKTIINLPNIIQYLIASGNHTYLKKGDTFIFSSPTMEYAIPPGAILPSEDCKYFIDNENLKNKNTMRKA